jgi:Spy/CpxP family protein refolding chaperone
MSFTSKIFTPTAAALLLIGGVSSLAFAEAFDAPPPAGTEHGPHEHGLPPHLAALNLSDAQKARIKALHESQKAQHEQQRDADKALGESLRTLSPSAPNYTQEVDRIATQMGQAHAQRIRDMAAVRAQEWAILTPSQQSQLAAMPPPEHGRWHHDHDGAGTR